VSAAERVPRIVALPGDGIGPEIMAAAGRLLDALGEFEITELLMGGASIDEHGTALTDEVLAACRSSDAVLLAAVGGPRWETTDPDEPRPEQGLLGIRKGLGLYANLRPVRSSPALVHASPLRAEVITGTDLLVVRELTGGIYFGDSGREGEEAHDTCEYSVAEIRRIVLAAYDAARARAGRDTVGGEGPAAGGGRDGTDGGSVRPLVTSVDKANVMETSRLWRETATRIAQEQPDVELEHMLADNAAMQLVANPSRFDVIVTDNLFGDILSDEAAMLTGSLGMLPSASLGEDGPGLFEPVHGSAPDITGRGVANPLAMFLSVALMLRYGLEMEAEAASVEAAVERALERGLRTPDLLGGEATTTSDTEPIAEVEVGTEEMTDAVIEALA
jgi:3-isopropylmalate dehydrogenase